MDEFDDALLATLRAHPNLGRKPFDAMLAGMRDDTLESVRYENWRPELLTYCYAARVVLANERGAVFAALSRDQDDEVFKQFRGDPSAECGSTSETREHTTLPLCARVWHYVEQLRTSAAWPLASLVLPDVLVLHGPVDVAGVSLPARRLDRTKRLTEI